ncbi:MAG: hypothetical protein HOY75_13355 [Streptomyces sp.]|nr:hypothetical protein [Streptomyces sp.]
MAVPARARLIAHLQQAGLSTARAEANVDAYAHELAEQIRTTDLPEIHVDMFDNGTQWAADLIDPKAQR